jgi:hypothetical protein
VLAQGQQPGRLDRLPPHAEAEYVNEAAVLESVAAFYADRLFCLQRRQLYQAMLAGSEDHASQVRDSEGERLQRILADVARRQDNPLRQVQECDPSDPFARGLRQTCGGLEAQRAATLAVAADLDRAEAAEPDRPRTDDVALLDRLPHLAVSRRGVPEPLLRSLFEITGPSSPAACTPRSRAWCQLIM